MCAQKLGEIEAKKNMLFCGAWEREEQSSTNIATENTNIIGGVMPRSTRLFFIRDFHW